MIHFRSMKDSSTGSSSRSENRRGAVVAVCFAAVAFEECVVDRPVYGQRVVVEAELRVGVAVVGRRAIPAEFPPEGVEGRAVRGDVAVAVPAGELREPLFQRGAVGAP